MCVAALAYAGIATLLRNVLRYRTLLQSVIHCYTLWYAAYAAACYHKPAMPMPYATLPCSTLLFVVIYCPTLLNAGIRC